jgi:hypothetical protein
MDVEIEFGDDKLTQREQAILLLEAAEKAGYDQSVVRLTDGAFVAPQEVADQLHSVKSEPEPEPEPKAPAKKAAAKKAAAKKSTTKKAQE